MRAATFKLLRDTAMDLIQQDGHIPSIAEVAVRSNVSRATAYRYFPSRSALITSVVDASLGSVRSAPPGGDTEDARERVHQVFKATFPRFQQFEPQLRAALQLAMEQWALQRAGLLEEEPYRRGHRVGILSTALAPLKGAITPAARAATGRVHQRFTPRIVRDARPGIRRIPKAGWPSYLFRDASISASAIHSSVFSISFSPSAHMSLRMA